MVIRFLPKPIFDTALVVLKVEACFKSSQKSDSKIIISLHRPKSYRTKS